MPLIHGTLVRVPSEKATRFCFLTFAPQGTVLVGTPRRPDPTAEPSAVARWFRYTESLLLAGPSSRPFGPFSLEFCQGALALVTKTPPPSRVPGHLTARSPFITLA